MLGCAELIIEAKEPQLLMMALSPELQDDLHKDVRMELCGSAIKLTAEGKDISSLRAALNTWIRLVRIALEIEGL